MIEIYDIEIYSNYFLICSIDYSTKERKSFIIDENINNLDEILEWIKEKKIRVGHNILGFDNLLLSFLVKNKQNLLQSSNMYIVLELKRICDKIINKKRNEHWDDEMKNLFDFKFNCIDTLAIMNTVDKVGLKQASINLKYYNVQELPYEPNSVLNEEEKDVVKEYCFNDCEISCLLYEKKIPDLELRKDVTKRYKIQATNLNDTGIAKKILDKYYSEATNIPVKNFNKLRSYNKPFLLDKLLPNIEFKTKEFKDLLEWFKKQEITEKTEVIVENPEEEIKNAKIKYDVLIKNLSIRFALGGVHSNDTPGKFKSTDNETLIDCDFSSYYPNLLLNYKVKPRHVSDEFLTIVETLTKERVKDKQEGRKKEADIKKIVINSIYGLLGSDYYWLKDTKALLKVTVTGQLWLAKFCEELLLSNIEVISLNTDGILCLVKKEQEELYYSICNNISKLVDIDVEYTKYKEYIRRDVNNYLSIDEQDKVKQKGKYFTTEIALNKGYYYPIIAKALNLFYTKNIPIEKTIKEEKDIYMFMASQKVDTNKFNAEFHYFENNQVNIKKLQKINRWVVTKNGGKFLKVENEKSTKERIEKKKEEKKVLSNSDLKTKIIGVETDRLLTIINKIENKEYDLDYSFYIKVCKDTIELINPSFIQTSMF